jgi:hypothetical protein
MPAPRNNLEDQLKLLGSGNRQTKIGGVLAPASQLKVRITSHLATFYSHLTDPFEFLRPTARFSWLNYQVI